MSRNHYEEAAGILPFEWRDGGSSGNDLPRTDGVLVVEIWKTDLSFWQRMKPEALVHASYELWVYRGDAWYRIRYNGELELIPRDRMPMVKRYANFLATRNWSGTVVLEGWR